jgi:VIT1/CCC1 family predicted Fe2+/Mn2+ transporter
MNPKSCFLPATLALILLSVFLSPSDAYSQENYASPDSAAIQAKIRQYTTFHSVGVGLCIGGGAFTAGGAIIILPTLGENGSHSVADRTLGLSLIVGGLAVLMSGIIVAGQSGAKLRVLKQQQQGISIGISPESNAPGVVLTYRF